VRIFIKYRVDQRIKVVEVRTGNKVFLVELEFFALETGIRDFEEHIGEALIEGAVYTAIWKGRLNNAQPHSFRFRKTKGTGEDG
jgi:hypothetical protein